MYRPALRVASARHVVQSLPKARPGRRLVSTVPPHHQSRSWKSSAARWGLAGGLVYYYNTATVFAEEPEYAPHAPPAASRGTEQYPSVSSISEQRRAQSRTHPLPSTEKQRQQGQQMTATANDSETTAPGSPEQLEEEASEQGAFNEETGEINWDCPCLGGMAYGPCGEQFRAAFSCFVFSKEEPKGVDCIEHFKTMQNCFREHPDHYGGELDDDEEGQVEGIEAQAEPVGGQPAPAPVPQAASVDAAATTEVAASPAVQQSSQPSPVVQRQSKQAQAVAE